MSQIDDTGIHQSRLPFAPWMTPHTLRLPGTVPMGTEPWFLQDEVFAAQMTVRDRLIAENRAGVHRLAPEARPAAEELRDLVLQVLAGVPGYENLGEVMRRPDGVRVPLVGPPLLVLGRLVQEDLVLLEKPAGATEHVLTDGIVCFPSNWTLSQKFGRPLGRIHAPVPRYDAQVAQRVQRLFDAIRPDAPLVRANVLPYAHDRLHSPRVEFDRHAPGPGRARFLRSERQVLARLPTSRAVVFSIHTYVLVAAALPEALRARLEAIWPGQFDMTG